MMDEAKWKSVLWYDESKFEILSRNYGCHTLQAKEEREHLACYQSTVQKPASMMEWACFSAHGTGDLHNDIYRFCNNTCCHPGNVFFNKDLAYFSKTIPNHVLHMLQVKESGC